MIYEKKAPSILLVGVGGAGCRIIESMNITSLNVSSVVIVDTDASTLTDSPVPIKVQIGLSRLNGKSTGGDVELGRICAEEDIEKLRQIMSNTEAVFIVAGLGGGTGTGALPVVLNAARDADASIVCFATLPFKFEGEKRSECARQSLEQIRNSADGLVIIPNDKLFESVATMNMKDAFRQADVAIGSAIHTFWKVFVQPAYLQLGIAELRRFLRHGRGGFFLGIGEGTGEEKVEEAFRTMKLWFIGEETNLLARAASVLAAVVGGEDMTLRETGKIMDLLHSSISPACRVFSGTSVDSAWNGRVSIAILGCEGWSDDTLSLERKISMHQAQLKLEMKKGRFEGVAPTLVDGEDLDIPTFIRRGVNIEKINSSRRE
jgi:cell division protein FtsZ